MEFSYTILYHPGSNNVDPYAIMHAFCTTTQPRTNLNNIHNCLRHPGVTHMLCFVKSKNFPFSTERSGKFIQTAIFVQN